MVVIFIRLVYHDATLVRLELEVTDTILLDVLHHSEGHGDRYIGSLFRVDEPVPDDYIDAKAMSCVPLFTITNTR